MEYSTAQIELSELFDIEKGNIDKDFLLMFYNPVYESQNISLTQGDSEKNEVNLDGELNRRFQLKSEISDEEKRFYQLLSQKRFSNPELNIVKILKNVDFKKLDLDKINNQMNYLEKYANDLKNNCKVKALVSQVHMDSNVECGINTNTALMKDRIAFITKIGATNKYFKV